MGFEPMTPGYKPADNQSSCIRCCRCLYGSGFLPRRRTAHCRTHIRVTKSYQIQGTIFRWDLNPRHEDFQSPAIPLSYCMDCCWCLCDHILPFVCEIIVEKKLRTQNFTPESAFFWFSSLSQSFLHYRGCGIFRQTAFALSKCRSRDIGVYSASGKAVLALRFCSSEGSETRPTHLKKPRTGRGLVQRSWSQSLLYSSGMGQT